MLFKLLISSILENLLNNLLRSLYATDIVLYQLDNKVIRFSLKDVYISLFFIFSENQIHVLNLWEGKIDCSVVTNSNILISLKNHKKLTTLIHNNDLKIEGDIQVIQNFIKLIDFFKFDLLEILIPCMGGFFSEGISRILCKFKMSFCKFIYRHHQYISEILTEEWCIAPGSSEVEWFYKEINIIERDINQLIKRILN